MSWLNFILGLNFMFFCYKIIHPPHPQGPNPPTKKKEGEKIKWSHNKYICQLPFSRSYMSFLKCYAETWKGESDRCHELFQKGASWKASQVWQESGRNSLQSLCGACCFSKRREGWRGEKEKMPHLATRGGVTIFPGTFCQHLNFQIMRIMIRGRRQHLFFTNNMKLTFLGWFK